MDYAKEHPVATKVITEWIGKGLLKRKFHIINGLDVAPSALPLLYSDGNGGGLYVVFRFAFVELVSHPVSSLGSPRFLSMESRPSFEPCDCLHSVICLSISTTLVIALLPLWYPRVDLSFSWRPSCTAHISTSTFGPILDRVLRIIENRLQSALFDFVMEAQPNAISISDERT